uniref:Thiamine-monophosphate kinase n=1 Tax=uncultured Thiotrichaceae bacterium TaxID=298394 RepID=A0A6S6SCN2_9GAMM|nr:MAG: Thiamine-monophosphate kinase (EC [uncultured Thiotrichaceae bacterium]
MSEFNLIRDYFTWNTSNDHIKLSVGDDAAILKSEADKDLVVSIDTSISGKHFPVNTPASDIGHKTLAVNLSDLAAMGATPSWFTLALTLPDYDPDWLELFSSGMRALATEHNIHLIGGDTTRGTLSVTIQVAGTVTSGKSLLRGGAQTGDLICASGYPGDAAAGLACIQQTIQLPQEHAQYCTQRLNTPVPQITLGKILLEHANSCIDISDGLLADLEHILQSSGKGAEITTRQLPFSPALLSLPIQQREGYALNGGDDYELLFTLPPEKFKQAHQDAQQQGILISAIGEITSQAGQLTVNGKQVTNIEGYNHFNT